MLKNKLYQYGPEKCRVPAHLHFGQEMFDRMIKNKDIVALINADTDERLSYGQLAQQTADIAVSLTRIGVRKGDVVSVCSEKRFEVIPTILGVICAGATFSPSDVTYGSFPLLHRLKISKPKIMFCSEAALETHRATFDSAASINHYIVYDSQSSSQSKTDGLKSQNEGKTCVYDDQKGVSQENICGSDHKMVNQGVILFKDFVKESVDTAEFASVPVDGWKDRMFILFSSGTTGLPKGFPMTHLSILLTTQCHVLENYYQKCVLNTREWYYTYGINYTLSLLRVGATVVYNPKNQEKDNLEAIQKYKIEIMQSTPSAIMELEKSPNLEKYDLSSVQHIISSGTPIGGELIEAIKRRLPTLKDIIQMYGMSEAGSVCCELRAPKGSKPGSSGVPCDGFVLKVVDLETHTPLGPNQTGEICIKGPTVMKGYLNNACPDCKDDEGFLKTGDIGYYDEDGYFFIINRIKELIKYNDISVAPAEFEAILQQHPAVREVGVVGAPHPQHGEAPVAFVALQPGAAVAEQELVTYLNDRVTFRMKLAGGVRFIDNLPRGAGDKLNRMALKKMLDS